MAPDPPGGNLDRTQPVQAPPRRGGTRRRRPKGRAIAAAPVVLAGSEYFGVGTKPFPGSEVQLHRTDGVNVQSGCARRTEVGQATAHRARAPQRLGERPKRLLDLGDWIPFRQADETAVRPWKQPKNAQFGTAATRPQMPTALAVSGPASLCLRM